MSTELITARKKLNSVPTMLKKGKYMSAVQNIHDGLILFLKNPVMRGERNEFEDILSKVTYSLSNDKKIREVYPLVINYTPGEERALLDAMRALLEELQNALNDSVKNEAQALIVRKNTELAKGQKQLDAQQWDEANKTFNDLVSDFDGDADLKADIADRYLNAGKYTESFKMLDGALQDDPEAIHLYNRIGMVLRKMKDFDTAEKYYLKALTLSNEDEYLHYNVGRLYFDWKKWDKMAKYAQNALNINPNFGEAVKMLKFAQKKI